MHARENRIVDELCKSNFKGWLAEIEVLGA